MPAFLILRTEVFRWHIGVCRLFFKDTFLNAWKNTNKCCCNIAVVKTDYIQKVLRACFQSHFYSPAGTLLLFCAKDGKSNQLLKKKKEVSWQVFWVLFVCIYSSANCSVCNRAEDLHNLLSTGARYSCFHGPCLNGCIWILGTFPSGLFEQTGYFQGG